VAASKSEPMKPAVCVPSVSTMPGFSALTRILRAPSSRDSTPVIASTAPLVPLYTALPGGGRRDASDDGADVDDARAFAKVLDRRLGSEQQAEHVDVEVPVEVFFGNVLNGREPVDTRVIDEDIQSTEFLDRRVDDALRVGRLGHIAANGG